MLNEALALGSRARSQLTRSPSNSVEFVSYNVNGNDNQLIMKGSNDGFIAILKAGGESATFDTDDTIKVINNTGAGVKFRACQICYPEIIERI